MGFQQIHTIVVDDRDAILGAIVRRLGSADKGASSSASKTGTDLGSRDKNEKTSLSSTVEMMLAVLTHWWIASAFNTFSHILLGVVIAPLMLLRSDRSIDLGLKWFQEWESGFYSTSPWRSMPARHRDFCGVIAALSMSFAASAMIVLIDVFLPSAVGYEPLWMPIVIVWLSFIAAGIGAGLGAAIAVISSRGLAAGAYPVYAAILGASIGILSVSVIVIDNTFSMLSSIASLAVAAIGAVIVTKEGEGKGPIGGARAGLTMLGVKNVIFLGAAMLPMTVACSLIITVVTLIIRFLATLRHFRRGLSAMPDNFQKLMFCTSPFHRPELVPGLETKQSQFNFDSFVKTMQIGDVGGRLALMLVSVIYFPAWTYRFSIKSTFWFWWPLAFVASDDMQHLDPVGMTTTMVESPLLRRGRKFAVGYLIIFAVVNLVIWSIQENHADLDLGSYAIPSTLFIGFLLVDAGSVPWQLFGLMSALIALVAPMWAGHLVLIYKPAKKNGDANLKRVIERRFKWLSRIRRAGVLCLMVALMGNSLHLALAANSKRCWIRPSPHLQDLSAILYGRYAPSAERCYR